MVKQQRASFTPGFECLLDRLTEHSLAAKRASSGATKLFTDLPGENPCLGRGLSTATNRLQRLKILNVGPWRILSITAQNIVKDLEHHLGEHYRASFLVSLHGLFHDKHQRAVDKLRFSEPTHILYLAVEAGFFRPGNTGRLLASSLQPNARRATSPCSTKLPQATSRRNTNSAGIACPRATTSRKVRRSRASTTSLSWSATLSLSRTPVIAANVTRNWLTAGLRRSLKPRSPMKPGRCE